MKSVILTILLIGVTACATTHQKETDLATRGVFRVKISIIDNDEHSIMSPFKVYFARLESPEKTKSNRILASERVDSNGFIYINPEPGIYTIVGADRYIKNTLTRTIFDKSVHAIATMEIKAGETKEITIRTLDFHKTVFSDLEDTLKYYHRALTPKARIDFFEFKVGKHFPARGKSKDTEKTPSDNEDPIIIENY